MKLSLGLSEASDLACMVFFNTDCELDAFNATQQSNLLTLYFRGALKNQGYLSDAIDQVHVVFYSWETVQKAGGEYHYFNS